MTLQNEVSSLADRVSTVAERLAAFSSRLPPPVGEPLEDVFNFVDGFFEDLSASASALGDGDKAEWREFARELLSDGLSNFADLLKGSPLEAAAGVESAPEDSREDVLPSVLAGPAATELSEAPTSSAQQNEETDSSGGLLSDFNLADYAELHQGLVEWIAEFRDTVAEFRGEVVENRTEFFSEVRSQLAELRELLPFGHAGAEEQSASEQSALGTQGLDLWHSLGGSAATQHELSSAQALDPLGFL